MEKVYKLNMNSRIKACITSLDPSMGGGTLAVMRVLYNLIEYWKMEPSLIFTSSTRGINRSELVRFDFRKWRVKESMVHEMQCISTGYFIPGLIGSPHLFSILDHLFLSMRTRSYLKNFSLFICAGGTNKSALPFILCGKKFVCWISTVLSDEVFAQKFGRGKWKFKRDRIFFHLALYLEKLIYQKAELILVHSEYTKERINTLYPFVRNKVRYVPVPVDVKLFKPCYPKRCREDKFKLLFVGRINDPRKNAPLLFKTFAMVKTVVPETELTVIGGKPKSELMEICKRLSIKDAVRFLEVPYNRSLVTYYNQADVFVLPSLQEGLGIVLLEALACGVPVVATKCGGAESIVQNGVNGYLVENNNCDAMSKALILLFKNEGLRKEMGLAGAEIVRNKFSIQIVERKMHKYLTSIFPEIFGKH